MRASPFKLSASGQLRHPWVLWLALWLAVFGAMAPTVSRTLNWARGDTGNLVEICTSAGPRWMALNPVGSASSAPDVTPVDDQEAAKSAPDPAPTPSPVLDHCPFCTLLADRVAPPLAVVLLQMVLPGKPVIPTVSAALFYPPFQTRTPPSRAPPTSLNS
ncbi:DUF2946 family protein [Rhodoferax sp.]|uniref:DUF2946 family protein n=1 Tax=Rhodoferax sp. TaxID=50421 RepID=UPI00284CCF56|nr:DUF2946 family protein [Rhodoferax sp.]MDR3369323.1 DUF2946 family protein [Rhodoferax sp.]